MATSLISKVKRKAEQTASDLKKRIKSIGKQKFFCIGRNKTGTTSLKVAFEALGYPVGNQRKAEVLTGMHYFQGNFQPIVDYCKSAQVFQDVPFSYPETYKKLDEAYPRSKFILTVRDDAEQWYCSLIRFHAKKFGTGGRLPTAEDMKAAEYGWPGLLHNITRLHGTTDDAPYNKELMMANYDRYNREVIEYFQDRPNDLLVINVAMEGAYQKFIEFLGVESLYEDFPWENKT